MVEPAGAEGQQQQQQQAEEGWMVAAGVSEDLDALKHLYCCDLPDHLTRLVGAPELHWHYSLCSL